MNIYGYRLCGYLFIIIKYVYSGILYMVFEDLNIIFLLNNLLSILWILG